MHALPELTYGLDALGPHLSAETLEYHWGKHHRAYVDNLNRLVQGTPLADLPLEEVVRRSSAAVFNNAAQHFNHGLYWRSLSPGGGGEAQGALRHASTAATARSPPSARPSPSGPQRTRQRVSCC